MPGTPTSQPGCDPAGLGSGRPRNPGRQSGSMVQLLSTKTDIGSAPARDRVAVERRARVRAGPNPGCHGKNEAEVRIAAHLPRQSSERKCPTGLPSLGCRPRCPSPHRPKRGNSVRHRDTRHLSTGPPALRCYRTDNRACATDRTPVASSHEPMRGDKVVARRSAPGTCPPSPAATADSATPDDAEPSAASELWLRGSRPSTRSCRRWYTVHPQT
jgi:hypothetical protein